MKQKVREELILRDPLQTPAVQTVGTSSALGASGGPEPSSTHIENIATKESLENYERYILIWFLD